MTFKFLEEVEKETKELEKQRKEREALKSSVDVSEFDDIFSGDLGSRKCGQKFLNSWDVEQEDEYREFEGLTKESARVKSYKEDAENFARGYVNWLPKRGTLSDMFFKHQRKLWCVKGVVLLRDEGRCRVCGEGVRGNTWTIAKLNNDSAYEEGNCFLLCGNCNKVWNRKFFSGSLLQRMQKIKLFILKRRHKGVGGSKKLNGEGYERMVELIRVLG
jgi:hypothetical protein